MITMCKYPSKYNEEEILIIKELINESHKEIISALGLPLRADGKVLCACPIHGGDNPRGFSYHPIKKVWQCWTHNCHEKYGSSILGLIQGVKGLNFWEALDFANTFIDNKGDLKIDDIRRNNFIKNKQQKSSISLLGTNQIESSINSPSHYFLNRQIDRTILNKFNAWDEIRYGHPMYKRACLPLYDNEDNLVGITGRATTEGFDPKWRHFPDNLPKNELLFGLNIAKTNISKSGIVNLVEGPIDVLKMFQYGLENTVCPLGNSISIEQIKLLLKYNTRTVIIWFDPDEGGILGAERIANKFRLYFETINLTSLLPSDPSDMTKEQIQNLYSQHAN